MVYWLLQGVDTTWFIEGILVHGWVYPLTNQFFEMPSLASHRCRMLTSTWSATVMRCSKETWKSMRRWFPIGQARLTRRAQHGEWENSGVPLLWSLMESMSVDPESWSKYLILVLNHQFWSILAVNLVELCCGPGLDFILIFAESTLDGRCWCWILMGNFEGVYPKFKPKGDDAGLKSGLWRILRSLRHQQRWIGGSSAPISHWVSRTNKITPPMPSRAAGAVKDDVKFDLNKLSKGPPDQPGMACETEEGEVKCQ